MQHPSPHPPLLSALLGLLLTLPGCPSTPDPPPPPPVWECVVPVGADFSLEIGCREDFDRLASLPLDSSIPGARSVKTILDRSDADTLYFQNSERYPIHWDFASVFLSLPDHPPVATLQQFNGTEYFSPTRRFVLGAATYYAGPGVWAWELAPYDSADAALITLAYRAVRDHAYFGGELRFHPTSEAIATVAAGLPADVLQISTEELFAGIDYQPLNLATSMGQLRFVTAEETNDVGFREIVVLEAVPNDIAVVAGIVTQTFQTPLSHINVLSQNRGTPNMGLRGAWTNEALRALDGRWVELRVGAFDWSVQEVTEAEAEAWWDANRPVPIVVTPMDLSVQEITDIEDVLAPAPVSLGDALQLAIPAFGGKVSHYAGMARVEAIPTPPAFAVPVWFFDQFMEQNGLWAELEAMLIDPEFINDRAARRLRLAALRTSMETGTVDPATVQALTDKLDTKFPGRRMRFRSSTNAEDVSGFNGAGLYESRTYDPDDPAKPLLNAVREVWASVYSDRAFAEREYYGIDHRNIGMALLSHRGFPTEDANGVAITANIFDPAGLEPAFYINVQVGDESVVQPAPGVTTDQLLSYYQQPGQPLVYLFRSSLVEPGETVLSTVQAHELSVALQAIHDTFLPIYGSTAGFYGMDVEFKFDSDKAPGSQLVIKQARPYPGWGGEP